MTAKHPDFTDVFYANALARDAEKKARDAAKKGLARAEAGDKEAARAFYAEALKWSKASERFEKLLAKNRQAVGTSSRARGQMPPRPGEDLSASRSPRQPSLGRGVRRGGKSGRGK